MSVGIEAMFTAALGLQAPWEVERVELNTIKHRIDFDLVCKAKRLTCPACGVVDQGVHDRINKEWRHLDFFQFEAWLHASVPRVCCNACNKTTQLDVPWAREGSGFTLLFEALALSLCKEMPVAHAANHLRTTGKRLWARIRHYIDEARKRDNMKGVRHIGIDETSVKKGHHYITVVHDLDAKRLLFGTAGRDAQCVHDFAQDLQAHGGKTEEIEHVCMDMSAAFAKGVRQTMPTAAISYDRFHVVALANQAMDEVRRTEMKDEAEKVRQAMTGNNAKDKRTLKSLLWGMRRNPNGWSKEQTHCMHRLQRSNLKSARAWRLKMALREVYTQAKETNNADIAAKSLQSWLSWAKRSRLEPFKKLARTIQAHLPGVLKGMLDGRSNAFVEAMNGLLQQAKTAARGFRTVENFLAIAYLRMSKLAHLPVNPLVPAVNRNFGVQAHRL